MARRSGLPLLSEKGWGGVEYSDFRLPTASLKKRKNGSAALLGHLGDYVAGDSQGKDVAVIFRKLRAVFQFIFLFNPSDFLPLHHSPCIQFLF